MLLIIFKEFLTLCVISGANIINLRLSAVKSFIKTLRDNLDFSNILVGATVGEIITQKGANPHRYRWEPPEG